MKKTIIILGALLPSYGSLFTQSGVTASIILVASTIAGIVITSLVGDGLNDKGLNRVYTGWVIHLSGILINMTYHNLIN